MNKEVIKRPVQPSFPILLSPVSHLSFSFLSLIVFISFSDLVFFLSLFALLATRHLFCTRIFIIYPRTYIYSEVYRKKRYTITRLFIPPSFHETTVSSLRMEKPSIKSRAQHVLASATPRRLKNYFLKRRKKKAAKQEQQQTREIAHTPSPIPPSAHTTSPAPSHDNDLDNNSPNPPILEQQLQEPQQHDASLHTDRSRNTYDVSTESSHSSAPGASEGKRRGRRRRLTDRLFGLHKKIRWRNKRKEENPAGAVCGCGRPLKAGWECEYCRFTCPHCHRALGLGEACDRCQMNNGVDRDNNNGDRHD
ncbi:hypothetical protein BCR43DRAFT_210862 [Syncephalastrum racemosum]|uniref:Uncharacterized protein n=1 Tax=Syncephalastrum racemosum TaxID=13706 RepID=A0A1X2HIQ9_SYNRA|nr:hypothetical protein BCR43DRAFT_210862 [Syncephalastrum racemosum]